MGALKVVCLNWGNYLGRGDEYVTKLRNMVGRHLSIPHDFVVVTEADLPEGRKGWWNKLSLFDMFDGDVLYLDLDIVITASIDELVIAGRSSPDLVWMRDDFSYSIVHPRQGLDESFKRLLGGEGCCNSSVVFWSGKQWLDPPARLLEQCHGDQNVLSALLWPERVGLFDNDLIRSYKYHVQRGMRPGAVTVFHGEPKPHQVREPWVREHWC